METSVNAAEALAPRPQDEGAPPSAAEDLVEEFGRRLQEIVGGEAQVGRRLFAFLPLLSVAFVKAPRRVTLCRWTRTCSTTSRRASSQVRPPESHVTSLA